MEKRKKQSPAAEKERKELSDWDNCKCTGLETPAVKTKAWPCNTAANKQADRPVREKKKEQNRN